MTATAEELVARLRRNPDDAPAYAALKAHYHQRGDHASLANLVEGLGRRTSDRAMAAQALYEAARLTAQYLGDPARAIGLFELALEREPDLHDAHRDLEQLLDALGDPRLTIDSLERRLALLGRANAAPRRLAVLRYKLGETWARGFGRDDHALVHYRAALDLDPVLVPALYAARHIAFARGDSLTAAGLLEREAAAEPERDRAISLFRELAHQRANALGDLDGAVRAAETALQLAPSDRASITDLAVLLHRRATQTGAGSEGDLERAATLHFQLAQQSVGVAAVRECAAALDLFPGHEAALDLLEFLAHDIGSPDVLPARWVGFLTAAPDAPGAAHRRRLLADAYVASGQLEDAVYCLEPLLAQGDHAAATLLSGLYGRLGREADAEAALGVVLSALPAEARITRLRGLVAQLLGAGDRAGAAVRAAELLALEPRDEAALELVMDAHVTRGDEEALCSLYAARGGDPRLDLASRVDALERATRLAPATTDAERAHALWQTLHALLPDHAEANAAIRAHLAETKRFDALADFLSERLQAATAPEERVDLLSALGRLHQDERGDAEAALPYLRALLEARPRELDTLVRLERIYGRRGDSAPLFDVLGHMRTLVPAPERALLLARMGGLAEDELHAPEQAVALYREARALLPGDELLAQRLTELLGRLGKHEEQATVLRERLEEASSASARADARRALARLLRGPLADPEGMALLYEAILRDGDDEEAVEALLEHAANGGDDARWVELATRREAQLGGDPRAQSLRRERARRLEALGRREEAIACVDAVLALAPRDTEALAQLAALYQNAGEPRLLAETLARLWEETTDRTDREALAGRIADLYDKRLDDPEQALRFVEVTAREADDPRAPLLRKIDLLDRLGREAERATAVDELIAAHRGGLDAAPSEDARVDVALGLVDVLEHGAHEPRRALETLASVCARRPHEDALFDRAKTLARDARAPEVLLSILERRLRALEGGAFVDCVLHIASLEEAAMGRPGRACERLCAALEVDPSDERIYVAAERTARAADDLPAYAATLGALADRSLDADVAVTLLARRGALLRELGQHDAAVDTYHQLATLRPEDADTRRVLREQLAMAGRHQELVMAVERELRAPSSVLDAASRNLLLRTAAQCWAGPLANRWEAIDAWKRVLAALPDDPEAHRQLARLAATADADASVEELLDLDDLLETEEVAPEEALAPDPEDEPLPVDVDPLEELTTIADFVDQLDDESLAERTEVERS